MQLASVRSCCWWVKIFRIYLRSLSKWWIGTLIDTALHVSLSAVANSTPIGTLIDTALHVSLSAVPNSTPIGTLIDTALHVSLSAVPKSTQIGTLIDTALHVSLSAVSKSTPIYTHIDTALHVSFSAVPKSTPIGTHINTAACFTFNCPEANTNWYLHQHHCMLHFQLSRSQHQLIPTSTPLHASLSIVPKSTPIGTHINTTACFTFNCPEVNTNWYPHQHHCMLHFQLSRSQHQLVPTSTPLHASLSAVPKSAPFSTRTNITACFTFGCHEINIRSPSYVSIKTASLLTKYKLCPTSFLRCLSQSCPLFCNSASLTWGALLSLQFTFDGRMSGHSLGMFGDNFLSVYPYNKCTPPQKIFYPILSLKFRGLIGSCDNQLSFCLL